MDSLVLGQIGKFLLFFWFADPEPSSVSCHGPLPIHSGVRLLLQQPLHAQILQVCMLLSVRNFQTASAAVNSWNPWSALVVYSEDSRVMELVWKCNQNSCHTCECLPLGDAFRDPRPFFFFFFCVNFFTWDRVCVNIGGHLDSCGKKLRLLLFQSQTSSS